MPGEIIVRMLSDKRSAVHFDSPSGTARGIDFYPCRYLIKVVARSLYDFHKVAGEPASDPDKSTVLAEKILWSKFLRPMALPTPANKLTAYSMLPIEAQHHVKKPPVIWQSTQPQLPPNDAVPPGSYFLKSNHGSGMFEEIAFPLDTQARAILDEKCAHWLQRVFGYGWGEWWYATITPHIFLERRLDLPDQIASEYKFFIVNGKLDHFHIYWRTSEGEKTSVFDNNLHFVDITFKGRPNPRVTLSSRIVDLCSVAENTARGMDFVRVDLYLDQYEEIWFGELTFTPNNGIGRYSSRKFEEAACKDWDVTKYFYPSKFEAGQRKLQGQRIIREMEIATSQ